MSEIYFIKKESNDIRKISFYKGFRNGTILVFLLLLGTIANLHAQDVLPFPPVPSASVANETLAESTQKRRAQPEHLPKDAPNIVIVLMDDVGFGTPSTFGGGVNTPTLSKVYSEGIAYNEFHTTSICSPTRAALLTGRNHTRVSSGTIAERAVDWDGYTGIIPKEAATVAEVLKNYGYSTSAFGKWHNTPANQTTVAGPFDYWPVNYGFQHFYGFLAGETSQYEPRLVDDFTPVEPPKTENYHLTTDLADHAITWMSQHKAYAADKPFLLYFAPGAGHAPHHIFKGWADKYKGKFDDGWDAYREKVFKRQKELGWIPKSAQLTARDKTMASWESIPQTERAFQIRMMEVFAGYVEHADHEVGRVLDAIEANGQKENTIVFFIWGDNGSSAEGQNGSISELLAQNGVSNTIEQQLAALEKLGGLDAIGGPLLENNYHSSWAWAGNTPFKYTKLVASHFGGTQNVMVIRWPKMIKPDKTPRSQFHHINDIVPTIYDILNIPAPKVVNGFEQMPMDGVSMKYTFNDAKAKEVSKVQFFDNNGSRGVYKDGWYACTFGPLYPWIPAQKGLAQWDSTKDVWELYNIKEDFTQFNDLAAKNPEKLKELQEVFNKQAKDNKDYPIGAGIWLRLHPEDVIRSPYNSWVFDKNTKRMPEFSAPGLGKKSNKVVIDMDVKENTSGVLYALGGNGGGVTLFMENGKLVYEYNMLIIERYTVEADKKLTAGKHQVEVLTTIAKPGAAAEVVITLDGKEYAKGEVKRTVPAAFTASETFDVGEDLGGSVSMRYYKKAPYKFEGKINSVKVNLL
ncbi:arylsulfatase [Flavobacterium sp. JAS]|uniref:arylsulfatase n=1 Tax=Flavobacterium sp. JAS TaxID=2897329 RepID=UPI001E4E94D2|nr:arylsulfatase [Flavobacterium sp. JAS]MCD0471868.1 arylsulfatase [Flavobacterium sp. JAS]